ncbi:MAG: methylmalonyl-CoA epimerase [Ignavibacteria bacterium]|nr:methylmalonyl-CoA epimerase [Ignavibacteria bacterium]
MIGIAILAAGKGKRMNSVDKPKVLVNLKGKPLLSYVLDSALNLEPTKIYVIVGFKKESVIEYLNHNYYSKYIQIVEQKEQLGTGHAILQLEPYISNEVENLLILSGDVPLITPETLKKFIEFHLNGNYELSLISTTVNTPYGYGRIIRNLNGELIGIVEQKDLLPSQEGIKEINSGIYIVKIKHLFNYLKLLKNDNSQREYYLTDIVSLYVSDSKKVGVYFIDDNTEVLGVNRPEELIELEKLLNKKLGVNMIKGVNHIGIAVSNLENSINQFEKLFDVKEFHIETVESQKVKIASFKVGNVLIELTAPTDDESPIAKFIQKRGEGIHHIAFEVNGIQSELDRLRNQGVNLINEKPVEGAHNMEIAFIHPKSANGVLIEFCQTKNVMSNKES